MAEYGEWNRKGATLSGVTAKKEYGVARDFMELHDWGEFTTSFGKGINETALCRQGKNDLDIAFEWYEDQRRGPFII